MILNWNKSPEEKDDKNLCAPCLKKKPSCQWKMEMRKKKRWKVEIIDVSYPESPAAEAGCLLCLHCQLCSFFFSSSITSSSAVSSVCPLSLFFFLLPSRGFFYRSVVLLPLLEILCPQYPCPILAPLFNSFPLNHTFSIIFWPLFYLLCRHQTAQWSVHKRSDHKEIWVK